MMLSEPMSVNRAGALNMTAQHCTKSLWKQSAADPWVTFRYISMWRDDGVVE